MAEKEIALLKEQRELLEDELAGKQMKEFESLVPSDHPERQQKITKIPEGLKKENLAAMISKLQLT
jgi:hypothetical protein